MAILVRMLISEIITALEAFAPPELQEPYDNSGLLIGDPATEATGVLVSLDCTEEVVEEAISRSCNVIVSHHPIIFSGLKTITGTNYVERVVIKAIKNDIAVYAIHTNLDKVFNGVNSKIAERLGLRSTTILKPESNLFKLSVFVPMQDAENLRSALFSAGAGNIGNYSEASFSVKGVGTFKGNEDSNPRIGEKGVRESVEEEMIQVLVESAHLHAVVSAMKTAHPYEEVAYDIFPLANQNQNNGLGLIGELEKEMSPEDFLNHVKTRMNTAMIRHTGREQKIKKVAVCGGSGADLIGRALTSGADAFVTADVKYHQFFDSEGLMMVCDIGHYESEQFTKELISEFLTEKFSNFAVHISEVNTNPINYS